MFLLFFFPVSVLWFILTPGLTER